MLQVCACSTNAFAARLAYGLVACLRLCAMSCTTASLAVTLHFLLGAYCCKQRENRAKCRKHRKAHKRRTSAPTARNTCTCTALAPAQVLDNRL
ncbi:hypothetical protein HMPREF3232_00418 [Fannyhessea vaginae]|nr:hypothetical protein HMPREF3232_00418 [Fannyhessea vaginae]